jgi:hypothetical protein
VKFSFFVFCLLPYIIKIEEIINKLEEYYESKLKKRKELTN